MIHCLVVATCKQTKYQNGGRQISIWERKYSTRFLMNNTHSCRMEGCGPPEISSPIPMVICERQGLPPSDLLFCFTCSRSCWRHLASAGPGKHSVHSNFCVNTEHPRSASLQVEIFDHLCWYSDPLQQIFCLLIWSFFFHSSARDCLCTHIHSTLNSYRIFKYYLSGGDSDSGQSSILWQKGCLQLKIIFKNQGVLPFRRYSSDWHIFLSYARSRTSAIFSIKSKASICSRCVCGNSSSVLLQVHR